MLKHKHHIILILVFFHIAYGFIWYSPLLFLKPWASALGKTQEELNKPPGAMPLILAVLGAISSSYILSWVVQRLLIKSFSQAVILGFILWLGIAFPATATHYAFAGIPYMVNFIDNLNVLVALVISSVVLSKWGHTS